MGLLSHIGFECEDFSECRSTSGDLSVTTSSMLEGNASAYLYPTGTGAAYFQLGKCNTSNGHWNTAYDDATLYFQFKFRAGIGSESPPSGEENICNLMDATPATKVRIAAQTDGTIKLYNASGTSVFQSSTNICDGSTHTIRVMCGTGASANWSCYVDSDTDGSSGTTNCGTSNHSVPRFGKTPNLNDSDVSWYYDDVIVADDAYPAWTATCRTLFVDGNGTNTSWTNDYQYVDDVPHDSDSTYSYTTGINSEETYTVDSCATGGVSGTILAVLPYTIDSRHDAANNGLIYHQIIVSSTEYNGSNRTTYATYNITGIYRTVSPDTSSAWTTTELDGIEIGARNRNSYGTRITAAGVSVLFYTAAAGPSKPALFHRHYMNIGIRGGT